LDHLGTDCVDGTDCGAGCVDPSVGGVSMIVMMVLIVVLAAFIAVLNVPA
jgi:hypothetical protein